MITEEDLKWLLTNLPLELIRYIIADYNPHCLFIMDNLQTYDWTLQCKITFGLSYGSIYTYYLLCQRVPYLKSLQVVDSKFYNLKQNNIVLAAKHGDHTIVLTDEGKLKGSGVNHQGQLGLGDTEIRNTYHIVPDLPNNIIDIACGGQHSVILTANGTVMGCGDNYYYAIGLEQRTRYLKFTEAKIPRTIVQIACGRSCTLLLASDGTLFCCGFIDSSYYYQHMVYENRIIKIASLPNDIVTIAAGSYYAILLRANGILIAYGENDCGQLGLGDTRSRTKFEAITDLPKDIIRVVCGNCHTIIMRSDGTLLGCGNNMHGQLGLGTRDYRFKFTEIPDLPKNIDNIYCGEYHTSIITTDGIVMVSGNKFSSATGLKNDLMVSLKFTLKN